MADGSDFAQVLTWQVLRDICQIVPSDRRKHSELFGFVDRSCLNEDERFYPALLEKMQADADYCHELNTAFLSATRLKDKQRSFSIRAKKWLEQQVPGLQLAPPHVLDRPEQYEALSPLQRDVYELWRRSMDGDVNGRDAAAPSTASASSDWQQLLEELRHALAEFPEADAERAAAIVALAEELRDACVDHQKERASRDAALVQARRGALTDELAQATSHAGGAALMQHLALVETSASLSEFEAAVESLPEALQVLRLAEETTRAAIAREDAVNADKSCSRAERRKAIDEAEAAEEAEKTAREALEDVIAAALHRLAAEGVGGTGRADADPIAGEPDPAPQDAPDDERAPASEGVEERAADHVGAAEGVSEDPPHDPGAALHGAEAEASDRPGASGDDGQPDHPVQPIPVTAQAEDGQLGDDRHTAEPDGEIDRLAAVLAEKSPVAEEPAPIPDPDEVTSAVWTGRKSIEDLLAGYLDAGELALAWHLADLAEEAGHRSPVPPILLKALAAGSAVVGPYDQSTQIMGEFLAAGMSAVAAAEDLEGAASLRARSLALAALLRPALMARDTNAREHLAHLSLADGLASYAPVRDSLASLRHDLQPSLAELTELAGVEKERRLPQITAEIAVWLPGARAAQSMHAPSNIVLHNILSPQGRLGALFEAALDDQLAPLEAEVDLLRRLAGDKSLAEDLVAEEEKAIGRPKRDAIKGMALDWICRKLREGAELLLRWRASRLEESLTDDRRKEDLRRHVSHLRRELERVQGNCDKRDGIDGAVQRCLVRSVSDLLAIVNGQGAAGEVLRVSDVLRYPLLRLPGICQPHAPAHDEAFAEERRAQRAALLAALSAPDQVTRDEVAALRRHIEDRAILPARSLIERIERRGALPEAELAVLKQKLADELRSSIAWAESEMASLRHELEPLQSIDLSTSQQIQLWLDHFQVLSAALKASPGSGTTLPMSDGQRVPDLPADFPQLREVLRQASQLRDTVRHRIMADQAKRLDELARRHDAEGNADLARDARQVAASLAERDLITVEDIIIRLQEGQSLALRGEEQDDVFADFYPEFVAGLAATEADAGTIRAAMSEGRRLGVLDYSQLEESDRKRSEQLFENWRQLSNAMKSNRMDLKQALHQFMERLGFTSVSIAQENTLSPHLRWMRMRSNDLIAQRWFLPPVFGSEARGSYPIFLAHRNIEDAQLVSELAKVGRDAPCILLVFDRMTKARRESFALAMRRAKQTVLLLDEAQVLYLTANTSWMERLFTCAAPFGYLQPYTTSAGNIPGEMFFGRMAEIAKIESATTDGCLVYGGRQLGKSALLHHVRKRFHQPQNGRFAYYLKIDEFGGQVQSADQIWSEIRLALAGDQILPKGAGSPEEIRAGVEDWLDRGGERRILLLIDEADMFLASEARTGFPNLNRLKDMMETSARRFKVVFAGLHNVRRMAKAPNSPLVHLSEPICIGPLNTSVESSLQARRLVVEPMKAAGFDYASPDLIHALLTRVNYYPSLVQVFCKALLEGISNQPRPPGRGPRWVLKKEDLFEGSSAQNINAQIRERFQWTLNLDPRYELIAKVMARHRLIEAGSGGGAMTPQALAREVESFWPQGYEKFSVDDFQAFLDEMVDLGVLIQLGRDKRLYGLRGAQVAQMLGQLEQLESEILGIADKEPRVDYDPTLYHRRVRSGQVDRRSPLPDSALASLFDTARPGLRFLVAPPAIWGEDCARAVADLAHGWVDGEGRLTGELLRNVSDDELRRLVDKGHGRRVLVIPAGGKVPAKWVSWLDAQPPVAKGVVLPVFVGGHEQISQLLPRDEGSPSIQLFRAHPWERTMLRSWLAEIGLQMLDTPESREALLEVSGGSPLFLTRLRPQLEALVGRREDAVAEIRKLGEGFSLQPSDAGLPERLVPVFCTAAELYGGSISDRNELIELLTLDGNPKAQQELALLERLGLFTRHSPEATGLSPLGALVFRTCERLQKAAAC